MYEVPGGLETVKRILKIIIGNKPLEEIMLFGDTWRSRGHKPLVHVISPAMDGGKMWEQHSDPSGLLDNIPAHIDMFVVDYYNLVKPELPKTWAEMAPSPQWLLWEYEAGKVRFNGAGLSDFLKVFHVDPTAPYTPPVVEDPEGGTPATLKETLLIIGGLVGFLIIAGLLLALILK